MGAFELTFFSRVDVLLEACGAAREPSLVQGPERQHDLNDIIQTSPPLLQDLRFERARVVERGETDLVADDQVAAEQGVDHAADAVVGPIACVWFVIGYRSLPA